MTQTEQIIKHLNALISKYKVEIDLLTEMKKKPTNELHQAEIDINIAYFEEEIKEIQEIVNSLSKLPDFEMIDYSELKSVRLNPNDFQEKENIKEILFRWHRPTLEESMKTCIEISSLANLNELIKEEYPFSEDIKIEFYGFDYRTGWKTFMVLVDGYPTGWLNNELKN